jgi:hypothetical protein
MKTLLLPLLATLGLVAGCASTRPSDADRLALYEAHAGAPVGQIRYSSPMGWDRIDDQHVVLQMRPSESWLLTLSGPCLDWGRGSPFIDIAPISGAVLSRFDKVIVPGSQATCTIHEIRPLDVKALRAAERARREGGAAQPSGT